MASKKLRMRIPKIAGFERVKYQNLSLFGLSSRAYSAYFGAPKRIIDVYNILYVRGKQKPTSTGRISHATSALVNANFLDMHKIESSNWPLLCANLLPVFLMFESRKAILNDDDKKMLNSALLPTPEAAERFAITEEEALGTIEFMPSPLKIQRYLNSAATLAIMTLFKQQAPDFKEERALLRRIKAKTYGAGALETQIEQTDLKNMDGFVSDLVLKTRVAVKGGDELKDTLLFKIARLVHEPTEVTRMEGETYALFE